MRGRMFVLLASMQHATRVGHAKPSPRANMLRLSSCRYPFMSVKSNLADAWPARVFQSQESPDLLALMEQTEPTFPMLHRPSSYPD
jgi:hypothetical protein